MYGYRDIALYGPEIDRVIVDLTLELALRTAGRRKVDIEALDLEENG